MPTPVPTAADLRAEIARNWIGPLYRLAAQAEIHPAHLSAILHERREAPPAVSLRIVAAIERQKRQRGEASQR